DGSYSFELGAPVAHSTAGTSEENKSLTFGYAVTDGDGDQAGGVLTIQVDDDTPKANVVTSATVLDDEAQGSGNDTPTDGIANANVATGVAGALFTAGADGVKSVALDSSTAFQAIYKDADGVAHKEAVSWSAGVQGANGATTWTATGIDSHATVATLVINADGSYSFTASAPLVHPTSGATEENLSLSLGFTVTDGDGDKASGTLNINVNDDTPISTGVIGTGMIGESAAGGSIAGTLSSLVSAGADGIGRYSVEVNNLSSTLTSLTSGGVALAYSVEGNALVAKAGGNTIFTLNVNPATGAYTFSLTGPLDHVDTAIIGGKAIPAAALSALDVAGSHLAMADVGGNDLAFEGRMPDGDVIIRVSNSGNSAVTWTLDSDQAGGTDYVLNIPAHTTWYVNVGNIPDHTKFDLDGSGAPNGITNVNPGHPITFTDGDSSLALDLSSAITVTDGDGDSVALNGQLIVTVNDDVPVIGTNASGMVEEGAVETITAALTGLSWGADSGSARTLSFNGTLVAKDQNGASITTLSSNGNPVTIAVINGVLTGFTGGINPPAPDHIVFTALLNAATGGYTFSLLQPLDHTAPNATSQYIDIALGFTATDADGDTSAASTITVRVDAAGSIDSINYSNLSSSVFVNLDGTAHTVLGQTVAGDRATDGILVSDKVVGIDNVTGVTDAMGGSANDVLIGGGEANKLSGNGGNDYLDGGLGADILDGGEGNDTFVLGADVTGSGTRNVQLGDGSVVAVNIDGLAGTSDKVIGGTGNDTIILERDGKPGFVADYNTAPGYLSGVEKIVGTDGNDVIILAAGSTADGGPITIEGGEGNDILGGSNSADILNGGDGNDLISGLGGNDTLSGGNGNDVIWGGLGADTIHGGAGSDTINVTADMTYAPGTLHSVPLVGLTVGNVDISGKAGTLDSINGGFDLGDTIYLKASTEGFVLDGYQNNIEGVERIVGTNGDDVIVMRSDYVTDEAAGRTTIEGGLGNDTIVGGAGNDVLDGGQGMDTLAGGDGADIIKGGADNDALWGGKASDNLYGNGTSNTGSDLNATAGEADSANYGGSADKYHVFFNPNAFGSGLGIWQVEALDGAPELMTGGSLSNTDNLYGIEKIQFNNLILDLLAPVRLFDGNNLVGTFTTITDANTAASAGFRIELVGTVTDQSATITKENLTVVGGAEDTGIVLTLDGVQKITLQGEAPIKVVGDGLNNTIIGNDGANTLEGGIGNDTLNGGGGNDVLDGGQGLDTLAGGDGADIIKGGADNDTLWGGKHADSLFGNGTSNTGADLNATVGEADSANYGGSASNYHVFFDTTVLGGGLGIWRVQALNGAPEFTGVHVSVDTDNLYGIEKIQFNDLTLDLLAPVRLFDGNNLVGTFTTITDANTAASAGFRIELVGTVINQSATITKEDLTVVGGAEDTGIVLTLDGVQKITLQGEAPIKVVGDGLNNTIIGNDGANVLEGGDGNDTLNGGAGDDTIVLGADIDAGPYGPRAVLLGDGTTASVSLIGLAGTGDAIIGGTGYDKVVLDKESAAGFVLDNYHPGAPTFSGIEEVVGSDGNDVILMDANYTSDNGLGILIDGAGGNDTIGGGAAADTLKGGDGNDLISGLGGNDILEGGAGSDEIWGGAGNDTINGGSGNDNITGGLGNDTIDGGTGGDTFNYAIGDGVDTIDGGANGDVLLTSGNATAESAVLTVTSTGFTLDVDGDGVVDVNATNIESVVLYQAEGADKITVRTQDAAETITIEGNSNLLQVYGNGIPSISGISTSELVIEGKGGNDVINASNLSGVALTLDGGAGNDTITGSAGADTIRGGEGNDTILYKVGTGADIIDGGSETGTSNPDYDVLKIAGDAVQRSFNIAKAIGGTDIVPAENATDIVVSYTGANGATVRADEIERIEVTLGSAGDSIAVGDLGGTAIAPTTVVINGGVGSDTIDLTGLVGTKVEINDLDDTTGGDIDTVKLAGKWSDYDIVRATDGTFTFSLGGHVVATAKNIEQFTFQGENGGAGGTMQAIDLINDAPHAVTDNNTGDPVVEAGGVANGTAGDASATGNVLTNDTDADGAFDSKHVTAIQFGAGPATAVPAGNGDVMIAGAYGMLTIHSDGSYAYALDNNDGDTQALAKDAAASDVFTYTMADAHGLTSSASLTINITGTNDAPVLNGTIADQVIAEDNALSFTVPGGTFSDVDSASLTYTATLADGTTALPGWLHFDAATMTFSGTPDLNWNGAIDVKVTASDGSLSVSDTFTLTVTPVNDAPIVTNDVYVTDEDTAISGLKLFANDSDIEGSPLTANGISVGSQLGGSISFEQNGTLYFKPLANESGYAVLQYGVSDGNLSSTGTVTIDVRPIADTATISGSGSGSEDAAALIGLNIAVGDTDGSEKVTKIELSGFPAGATFSQGSLVNGVWVIENAAGVNTNGLTMTPPHDFAGNFNLGVSATVVDSATLSDHLVHSDTKISTGSIGVSITAVNDAPAAVDDVLSSVAEDSGVRIISFASLLGNDGKGAADETGQSLTITGLSNIVGGTAVINGTNIEFTPSANFNGAASFDYTVRDNGQTNGANDFKTDVGSVSFAVTPVNDAPAAVDDVLSSVAEDSGVRIISFASLLGNDGKGAADETGQSLTITGLS
ncbi:T1SS-143 domain-containing protein, partial [Neorhizobium sp. 2083]|uniref:tandem-95 repeat protein n=1 Tax=Neorhizobium sp. 2083 TaxID=2817762 RepID=UPI00286624FD